MPSVSRAMTLCIAGLAVPPGLGQLGADEVTPWESTLRSDELVAACPAEVEACKADTECTELLDQPEVIPAFPPPPEVFTTLIRCFRQAEREVRQEDEAEAVQEAAPDRALLRRVLRDVQCDACRLVVGDFWTMLLHRPANKGNQLSLEQTLGRTIESICGDPENREDPGGDLARWVGMFNFHNCTAGWAAPEPACEHEGADYTITPDPVKPGSAAMNEAAIMNRAAEPSRAWYVGIYSILCQEQFLPYDMDIAEAFAMNGGYPPVHLKGRDQVTKARAAREAVAVSGCEATCADAKKGKSGDKKKSVKSKAAKKKSKKKKTKDL